MLKRIFMSHPGNILLTLLFVSAISAATILLKHLSRGTIPPRLEPVATRWVNAGYDLKRFRSLLWLCFWFLAAIFFLTIGCVMYWSAIGLGRKWN